MPPHCDSMDGPVVVAAQNALEKEVVEDILPYVPADGEEEVRNAFELATKARTQGPEAKAVADLYFFETVVRIHRAGEGAPFNGLKPAGLDVGPVIPIAEGALAAGTPERLIAFFVNEVEAEIAARFQTVVSSAEHSGSGMAKASEHVHAVLGLQVWAHKLYGCLKASPHGGHHEHDEIRHLERSLDKRRAKEMEAQVRSGHPCGPGRWVEHWHLEGRSGALRAAIFGFSDGLVSNLALILGVAGSGVEAHVIVLAGVAGLLAGAFSMGTGEYLSMRVQKEVLEHALAIEAMEIRILPGTERDELAGFYRDKGLPAPSPIKWQKP